MNRSTVATAVIGLVALIPATSASAHVPDDHGTTAIHCGRALETDRGPAQACGEDLDRQGRNGFYYPDRQVYEWGPWQRLVCACLDSRTMRASDGYTGPVEAYPRVEERAGVYSYGTQYRVWSGQQVQGRWGRVVYPADGFPFFEPSSTWMDVDFDPEPGDN
jgi:hypothetical protein